MKRRSVLWMIVAAIALLCILLTGQDGPIPSQAIALTPVAQTPVPAPTTVPAPVPAPLPTLPTGLSGSFTDPQGAFQVGILDGYTMSMVSGSPLFQKQDGSAAYSIVRVPLTGDAPLADIALVEIVQRSLGRGEGFQTQAFNPLPGGGLQIAWTGRLSQGATPAKPVSGKVLAKQQRAQVFLVVVAALETAVNELPQVAASVFNSLTLAP